MGKVYDDWGRLVEAVMQREKMRQLFLQHSRSPSDTSSSASSYQLDHVESAIRLQEEVICLLNGKMQFFEFESILGASLHERGLADKAEEDVPILPCLPINFLHQDFILQIKSIANTMFASSREQDFCEAFIRYARANFVEYLTMLEVEELTVDEVNQMEWKYLNSSIKRWCSAIKNFLGHYLGWAKDAFNQILGEYGQINLASFIESSQDSVMSLLNFGHAIASKPHKEPEWLFLYVDMYKDLASVIPDVDALFPEGTGSFIQIKFRHLLSQLKESVKLILEEFPYFFESCHPSETPNANGGIQPVTKFIVNYIFEIGEHGYTLNSFLDEEEPKDKMDGWSIDVDIVQHSSCPLAGYLQSLASVLEIRLDIMSNAYKDLSWKHIFMMNNIHYMVQKIMDCKACPYFGDEWIRSHVVRFRQHAMSYQRVTWYHVGNLLAYHDIDWTAAITSTLKARCRAFATAFEKLYEIHTRLCVPDIQLRKELRLLALQTVVRGYQCFHKRVGFRIAEKHFTYTELDLENYIMDLLEGSSKSLKRSRKWRWIKL